MSNHQDGPDLRKGIRKKRVMEIFVGRGGWDGVIFEVIFLRAYTINIIKLYFY